MAWTAPRTWVAGEVPTAANFNTHVRDNLKVIGDPWTAYTPTWTSDTTNPVLNNGTLAGFHITAGKLIHVRILLTAGSTTTYGTGQYRWALPASPAETTSFSPMGRAMIRDATGSRYFRNAAYAGGGLVMACDDAGVQVSQVAPMTWANGDQAFFNLTYEAA